MQLLHAQARLVVYVHEKGIEVVRNVQSLHASSSDRSDKKRLSGFGCGIDLLIVCCSQFIFRILLLDAGVRMLN